MLRYLNILYLNLDKLLLVFFDTIYKGFQGINLSSKFIFFFDKAIMLELKNIPLDHDLRSVRVSSWENHFITFGYDGKYNLYESDGDGQWKKVVVVNCSHWQTGGLMAAQADVNACNVLTLSRRGNFMCTSFK